MNSKSYIWQERINQIKVHQKNRVWKFMCIISQLPPCFSSTHTREKNISFVYILPDPRS